jgi:hypothetical protein
MAGGPGLEDEDEAPPQLAMMTFAKSAAAIAIANAKPSMNLLCIPVIAIQHAAMLPHN